MTINSRTSRLANGVRVATATLPWASSVVVGVWVDSGGRNESAQRTGASHFVEHMLFKGTRRRTPRRIAVDVEEVGGHLNAFTSEDHTCYHAQAAARHVPRLADVLLDMALNARFPAAEVEHERAVICEEIAEVNDQPAQRVEEMLSAGMWPGHPLGRPLTGTHASVQAMSRAALVDHFRRNYRARSIVLTAAGQIEHEDFMQTVQTAALRFREGRAPAPRPWKGLAGGERGPQTFVLRQDCEQTHLAIGFRVPGRHDSARFALRLLSVMLGENMSSRLFQSLREQRGYCYSVSSSLATFSDAGAFVIEAGLDGAHLRRALALIYREVHRLQSRPVSAAELRRAREYLFGHTEIVLEAAPSQMFWCGESLLGYGRIQDPAAVWEDYQRVTPGEVMDAAQQFLCPSARTAAIITPED